MRNRVPHEQRADRETVVDHQREAVRQNIEESHVDLIGSSDKIKAMMSDVVMERLDNLLGNQGMSPQQRATFFDLMATNKGDKTLKFTPGVVGEKRYSELRVGGVPEILDVNRAFGHDFLQAFVIELVRIQLLNSMGSVEGRLRNRLDLFFDYGKLLQGQKHIKPSRGDFITLDKNVLFEADKGRWRDDHYEELTAKVYETDKGLFADQMILAAHQLSRDDLSEGFRRLPDSVWNNGAYGFKILLSSDGLPYRAEAKENDLAYMRDRLVMLEDAGGERPKTYDELRSETKALQKSNKDLVSDLEILKKTSSKELEDGKVALLTEKKRHEDTRAEADGLHELVDQKDEEIVALRKLLKDIAESAAAGDKMGSRGDALKDIVNQVGQSDG